MRGDSSMEIQPPVPARRSCISVPASAPAKLAKSAALGADEVVIDLEDSVVPDAKHDARDAAIAALASWSGPAVSVRVNPPRSPWCHLDLAALASLGNGP